MTPIKKRRRLTKEEQELVLNTFDKEKWNCASLARHLGMPKMSVWNLLKRKGVEFCKDQSKLQRKFPVNEDYFELIDSNNKAYFLGLLYADGCNHSTTNEVEISLQIGDAHILESFAKEMSCDKPLQIVKRSKPNNNLKDVARFSVSSRKMQSDLISLGVIKRKSLVLEFPKEKFDKKFMSHFVRGYFDGDGCFCPYIAKRHGYKQYTVNFPAPTQFCNDFQDFLKTELGVTSSIASPARYKNGTKVLAISGHQVFKFLDYIYTDAELKLERKYQKYLEERPLIQDKLPKVYEILDNQKSVFSSKS